MGTVLSVYDGPLPASGRDLVAAAYVLYGPITAMVVARNGRVSEAVVEADGTRRVVDDDVRLPDDPTVYGFGGRVPDWTEAFAEYAHAVERELKLRYGGAMIADVNQVLTYGGVFAYPELESSPEGKLRLQFEANPIAYVMAAAGGASTDGSDSLSFAANCAADPDYHGTCGEPAGEPKIVVVSAGNSGAHPATVGTPGVAPPGRSGLSRSRSGPAA
jgi:fructose-1,6-bisphosphatase I